MGAPGRRAPIARGLSIVNPTPPGRVTHDRRRPSHWLLRPCSTMADSRQPGSVPKEADAVVVVYVTAPDADVARTLADALVGARLAACVNIVPGLTSLYRWEGKVQADAEVLLIAKTTAGRLAALDAHVREHHPYDMPEVLALPTVGGSAAYLKWVAAETRPEEERGSAG